MRILDRYIATTLAVHFLYSLLLLLVIFTVVNVMRELGQVGTGKYDFGAALWFILLSLPNEAYKLIPAAALLGGVTGLGDLAAANEIVAINTAGVSRGRLTLWVLQAGVVMTVAAVLLGEFVAAPLVKRAQSERGSALSGGLAVTTASGFWTRDRSSFVNARSQSADGVLLGLYVFEFDDDRRMIRFTHAEKATYADDHWVLENVVDNRLSGDAVTTQKSAVEVWDFRMKPRQVKFLLLSASDLSFRDLFRSIRSLSERREDSEREELALWRRLSWPLTTAVMVFLAVPFVLGSLRRTTVGVRIAVGALAGVGFQMFNTTFGAFALAYGVDPRLCALLPTIVALAGGMLAMRLTR